jgi:probable phosphoglycerate mutase
MKLYLVRHGESEGNAGNLTQGKEGGLSPHGIKQAKSIAERLSKIDFDLILASDYERAQETASYIWEQTEKPLTATPLLREREHPGVIIGKDREDPEVISIRDQIWSNYHLEDWHHSDEENFSDLKKRSFEFIKYLEQFEGKNVVAVTHGFFLRVIIATMMLGEKLDPLVFASFAHFVKTKNTGITLCEKDKHGWHLVTWNDHAHLG